MKRKQYIHKMWAVTVECSKRFPEWYEHGGNLGQALKHNKDFAKDVPKTFGSYEAAWNCEAMVKLREMLERRKHP